MEKFKRIDFLGTFTLIGIVLIIIYIYIKCLKKTNYIYIYKACLVIVLLGLNWGGM